MGHAHLRVTRRPTVAILATGDELVMPGEKPAPDQIVASNSFALAALAARAGAIPRRLPIARDDLDSLRSVLGLAAEADLIVTTGGASAGDHDLFARAAPDLGLERTFHKVAMRPGKPLMAGRVHRTPMIGLPGNPVSALVCGLVFMTPAIGMLQGLPARALPQGQAPLAASLGPNARREHYMRATMENGRLRAFERQDSSLQKLMAEADALVVRPPEDPAREAGDLVAYLPLFPRY
jgi:molybdopterin molybdotransferase